MNRAMLLAFREHSPGCKQILLQYIMMNAKRSKYKVWGEAFTKLQADAV